MCFLEEMSTWFEMIGVDLTVDVFNDGREPSAASSATRSDRIYRFQSQIAQIRSTNNVEAKTKEEEVGGDGKRDEKRCSN